MSEWTDMIDDLLKKLRLWNEPLPPGIKIVPVSETLRRRTMKDDKIEVTVILPTEPLLGEKEIYLWEHGLMEVKWMTKEELLELYPASPTEKNNE